MSWNEILFLIAVYVLFVPVMLAIFGVSDDPSGGEDENAGH